MNETTKLYSEKAKKFLLDADYLLQIQSIESAVSRAYYAMFYMVKSLLHTIGNNAFTHQGVLIQFNKHFIRNGFFDKKYNNILTKALHQRMVGDYEIGKGIELDLAVEIVKDAHEFVDLVIDYLNKNNN